MASREIAQHSHAEREPGAQPAATPAHAAVALQRSAGNAAIARRLLQRAPLTEAEAIEKTKKLPGPVQTGNGRCALQNDAQRGHFLRAGQAFFGSYEDTIKWFSEIRNVVVPGGVMLHESAAKRLEAVKAAMGADMPNGGGGFQLRSYFDANSSFSRRNGHTLGLAVDYDAFNMVRIGSHRKEPDKDGKPVETSHNADFLKAVTGQVPHEEVGDAGRRNVIKNMGDATAAGNDPAKVKGGEQLLTGIASETDRLAQASAGFQQSLGKHRDKFLELRKRYHAAAGKPKEQKAVMEEVPAVVQPWQDALANTIKGEKDNATAARLDPEKIPPEETVRVMAATKQRMAQAANDMGLRYKVAEGEEEQPLTDKDRPVLEGWEKDLKLPGEGTTLLRCAYVAASADALGRNLAAVAGADGRLKRLADLQKMLVSDPVFLFGGSANKVEDTPSLAQMVESGFFTPGSPSKGDGAGKFDAKFIQVMAKHGFDSGAAWGGPYTDSMHFELVTDKMG